MWANFVLMVLIVSKFNTLFWWASWLVITIEKRHHADVEAFWAIIAVIGLAEHATL